MVRNRKYLPPTIVTEAAPKSLCVYQGIYSKLLKVDYRIGSVQIGVSSLGSVLGTVHKNESQQI